MRTSTAASHRVTLRNAAAFLLAVLVLALGLPAAAEARQSAASDEVPGRLLVKFSPGASAATKSAARSAIGATKIKSIPQLGVDVLKVPATASATALARLSRNPNVQYAEHDARAEVEDTTPNDYWWPRQWGQRNVGAPAAWDLTTGARSTTIAILDTGVNAVADLEGKLLPGRNILAGSSNAADDHGHGTMAAGVAAAVSNNGIGVASYCWSCTILPVKVMDSGGNGYMSDVAAGITWATDNGADIVNMSLSGSNGTTTLANAVKYAADRDVMLFASAGNAGTSSVTYPGGYADVVAVAGTTSSNTLFSWSNRGSWVDLSGPGSNWGTSYDGRYADFTGTSSAAPAVAGVAGLARSYRPTAAARDIRAAMQSTAVGVDGIRYGRVDALATLTALGGAATTEPTPEPTASPTPSPEPTEAAPSPEPSEPAAPATTTTTFSGTLAGKTLTATNTVTAGAGDHSAVVEFQAKSATLTVRDSAGRVIGSTQGSSPLAWSAKDLAAGSYDYEVTSTSKTKYSLAVTHATP
jgi:subtilisin family serine protease